MTYRFDEFQFDRDHGLEKNGVQIPLEPQVLDLLEYLIENRERVVSREELNHEIWNARIVSEAALSSRIRAVRKVLGDDRSQQKYVRTHPKRGFKFVAPVEFVSAADSATAAQRKEKNVAAGIAVAPDRGHRRSGIILTFLGVVALLVGVSAVGWLVTRDAVEAEKAPPRLSIAVLPFDNLSGDASEDYYADAFTEDLITDLSRIRDAFVIARRSSFTYKGKTVDVKQVAEELGVRYVLEGSVRRSGDEVRINAQLIDGKTNRHLWSDRFVRNVADVFSGQYEVTGQIASALKAELREADLQRQGPPESLEAWDYALKGNVLLVRANRDFQEAYDVLQKAIALDPSIASAWSGLAFVHFAASFENLPGISKPNSKDLSLEAAQRAVSLDPKNAEGHWMVGVGYARNGQTKLAWTSCKTAMKLNPNNDCGYVCAGLTKMAMGQPAEAIPYFEHSLRLNPRFRTYTKHKFMGLAFVQAGQDKRAIEAINRALAESPKDAFAHLILSSALALDGQVKKASAALDKFLALSRGDPSIASLRMSHAWLGPGLDRVLEGLSIAGLRET